MQRRMSDDTYLLNIWQQNNWDWDVLNLIT